MAYWPIPHWDRESTRWDVTTSKPAYPHYFYYYEADLYVRETLSEARIALELGCGTCGSTLAHARLDLYIVALDYSRAMIRAGQRKIREAGQTARVDLVIADECSLPFRNDSFDVVYSRGVALSYAANAVTFARQAYGVLRAQGRLAIDYMNRSCASGRRYHGYFLKENGRLYYHENLNEDGKQLRRRYLLRPTPETQSLERRSATRGEPSRGYRKRPRAVEANVVASEEWWAMLYTPQEVRALLRNTGFATIKQYPLGCFTYLLKYAGVLPTGSKRVQPTPAQRELVQFITKHRDMICRLQKELAETFRLTRSPHIFATARKDGTNPT